MQTQSSTAAIILAAGSSSRMEAGRHKLLLPLGDRPVLIHVLAAALASQAHPIILVLGYQAEQIRAIVARYLDPQKLLILENPHYQQGMSTSLQTGIHALSKQNTATGSIYSTRVDSALILLGDQPLISTQIIDTLLATYRTAGKSIVAPLYNKKRGNPVLFSAALFPELLTVTGDEGGRSVIQHHASEIATVEIGDQRANYDIDTWEAYQQVVVEWEEK